MLGNGTSPQGIRWLSLSVTISVLAVIFWLASETHSTQFNLSQIPGQIIGESFSAPHSANAVQGSSDDLAARIVADALDREIYMPYGCFTQERMLADYNLAPDEEEMTADIANEIYLPYGEFTDLKMWRRDNSDIIASEEKMIASLPDKLPEEFYLPYGSFSEARLWGEMPRTDKSHEIAAGNSPLFAPAPTQCNFRGHGGSSIALANIKECM